ncbi:MAG: pilus assembly protein [Bifidobacteriaceae bacterium]|jgi:Flp pilus assembly protein TadG|nr:pilus assembly protein [Bifidobacteriaceae bacterium]
MSARTRGRGDRGSVTVELAIALPAVALLLVAVMALGALGVAQLRCQDGARAGARAAALGLDDAAIRAAGQRSAGPDAGVAVGRAGGIVTVTVSRGLALPGLGSRRLAARAAAACEPERGCG